MKNHFQKCLLLACVGTLSASFLMFAPTANAGFCEDLYPADSNGRRNSSYSDCSTRQNNKDFGDKLHNQIINTPTNMRDFGGGLFNLLFSLRPSLMYSNDGIGYGAQTRFTPNNALDFRMGLYFQSEITTLDLSTTYKFGNRGEIQPFIGGGWQGKSFASNYTGNRDRSLGMSLLAGVDIPLGNMSRVSAQINQPISSIVSLLPEMTPSPVSTEFQVMVTLFDF